MKVNHQIVWHSLGNAHAFIDINNTERFFTVREINIIGLSRGRGENVCEAQVLHLGGSLQFPGKGLKIPALTKSGSLWAGPRHQYFLKLPR